MAKKKSLWKNRKWFIVAATTDPETGKRKGWWETVVDENGDKLLVDSEEKAELLVEELKSRGYMAYSEVL